MRKLHIIMPMAGEGARFKNNGWVTPKPLIIADGKELYCRAVDSINVSEIAEVKYSFIVRKEHISQFNIDSVIKKKIPQATIFSVEKTTRGAVETCLIAKDNIEDNEAIIIMDCDLEFKSKEYLDLIFESLKTDNPQYAGVLLSFKSQLPKYSYAEINELNHILRTAEKEVISDNAICGAYFFSKGKDFKEVAQRLLNESNFQKPEFYVSLLYNYLINDGKIIKLVPIDEYYSYGTPEELNMYI